MKKTEMLKKNYEFKAVFSKGKYHYGNVIDIFILKNNRNFNMLGIAVSSKFGKAVKRNKLKRYIRESYKFLENSIVVGNSIIILSKKNVKIEEITYKKVNEDLNRIFRKAELIFENAE